MVDSHAQLLIAFPALALLKTEIDRMCFLESLNRGPSKQPPAPPPPPPLFACQFVNVSWAGYGGFCLCKRRAPTHSTDGCRRAWRPGGRGRCTRSTSLGTWYVSCNRKTFICPQAVGESKSSAFFKPSFQMRPAQDFRLTCPIWMFESLSPEPPEM